MRSFLICLYILFLGINGIAMHIYPEQPQFKIVSDTFDRSVAKGKCLITGTVQYQGSPTHDAKVCAYNELHCTQSNKKGTFSLVVDTSELAISATIPLVNTSYLEDYKFESQHHLQVIIYVYPKQENMTVKKPVIYVYNSDSKVLNLEINTNASLTFTYPNYQDGWSFSANADGALQMENGSTVPYLFWEGEMPTVQPLKTNEILQGSVLQKENICSFLETQLESLGFNPREKTDFITFWVPQMIQYEQVFVQFLVDSEYDNISTLTMNEIPDSERRIYLLFSDATAMDKNMPLEPQVFESIERKGLTLIEWGGSEITPTLLLETF